MLTYLYDTVDYRTGRLEPAIRTIAKETVRAYSAVHRALKCLRKYGFIDWMRRSKAVEDPQPGGPQVEQASNAYVLLCPKAMCGWIARLFGKPRQPECEKDRRRRERDDFETMLAGMTAEERLTATWDGDSLLGKTLAELAAAVDRREMQDRESSSSDETGGV